MDQEMVQGEHEVTWESDAYPAGFYFFSIYNKSLNSNDQFWKTNKMILTR